jgi:hypothetical protein
MNILIVPIALWLAFVVTCSTQPLHKKSARHHHIHKIEHNTDVLVTDDWIKKYKEAEAAHGNYTIEDDNNIKQEGTKFRVPQTVRKHYGDLITTTPESP